MVSDNNLSFSIANANIINAYSPFSREDMPYTLDFPCELEDENIHYCTISIDCSNTYNSSTISELEGYEGEFYSCKVFIDGTIVYDTYYSTAQYDELEKNQDILNLKYSTVGRCGGGMPGYWHYSKMQTYCMRLYNRGLSEEEIIDNYNTTKAYYSAIIGN